MKKKLLFTAFLGIALSSCKKDESNLPSVYDYQDKKNLHYFYIQNNLDKNVTLEFNSVAFDPDDNFLLDGITINRFYKVAAFRNQKTLVRVCYIHRGVDNDDVLNLFYYKNGFSKVNDMKCILRNPEDGQNFQENLWDGELWDYTQKSNSESEYTLIVDQKLLDSLTPYWVPKEETNLGNLQLR